MKSITIRACLFVLVGLAGFALGGVVAVKEGGVLLRMDEKSILVDASRVPTAHLLVGETTPGRSPVEPGFSVDPSHLVLPREGVGRVVLYELTPLSWCEGDVCEPCRPEDACTIIRNPPPPMTRFGALLEPLTPTPLPTPDPFVTATATATATATPTSTPTPTP